MRRLPAATYLTIVVLCGATTAEERDQQPSATPSAAAIPTALPVPPQDAPAATGQDPASPDGVVRVTTIDPNKRFPVCRRYVPTGSRISTQRCEPPSDATTASQQADHERIRRDMAEMRALQTMREQVRAQALAESVRRIVSP